MNKKIKIILSYSGCTGGGNCPTIYQTDDGRLVIQGNKVEAEECGLTSVPNGEGLVVVPIELLKQFFNKRN